MDTTRKTLLIRLKTRSDSQAWREFYQLYGPLLYRYARSRGLSREDAEDVRSQCLVIVVQKIAEFEYDKAKGGFKNWLRRIASNKIVDLYRKRREKVAESQHLRGLLDPEPGPDEVWEQTWRNVHLRYCVEQVRDATSPRNYEAFRLLVLENVSVDEVCHRLGMNRNQVYKAKSRVLRHVGQTCRELFGEEL